MEHCDADVLALVALGEPAPAPDADHLAHCPLCSEELESLTRVVGAARTATDEDLPAAPPDRVWAAIAGELRLQDSGAGTPPPPARPTGPVGSDGAAAPALPDPAPVRPGPVNGSAARSPEHLRNGAPPAGPGGAVPNGVTPHGVMPHGAAPLGVRRRRRMPRWALAACAALLGAVAGVGATLAATGGETPGTQVTAKASLQPVAVARADGTAQLDRVPAGSRSLEVSVKGLPATSGYFEVWLMDPSHRKLIAIGTLGPDGSARLTVPDNVDLHEYSVVDVSVQPYNGSPAHSGDSVVRGPLSS
ncbi:anti-sigma factor [Streptacidiphilus sp. ASG 303]|uniref:anti-sigma factor n=1 Tax=Streptacidiphilus sp. ASG 303 TaxID=2896847 RepID=UPI001E602035|nr:anti-sigma factor [Streptacidiphilus sp. ASG 303]MCD0481554.1 anti-sigma factor [Streptacidiphilus sp. ASG 303]